MVNQQMRSERSVVSKQHPHFNGPNMRPLLLVSPFPSLEKWTVAPCEEVYVHWTYWDLISDGTEQIWSWEEIIWKRSGRLCVMDDETTDLSILILFSVRSYPRMFDWVYVGGNCGHAGDSSINQATMEPCNHFAHYWTRSGIKVL